MKEQLSLLFGAMAESRGALFAAIEAESEAREDLKTSEMAILNTTDPKSLGSNEAARMACIRAKTADERTTLEDAEKAKRAAQYRYEVDCLAVDCLKWQIRADLAAKGMMI